MFIKYYFKIKYIKGIDNIKVNIFSRKVEILSDKKVKRAILKIDNNRKIRSNYL